MLKELGSFAHNLKRSKSQKACYVNLKRSFSMAMNISKIFKNILVYYGITGETLESIYLVSMYLVSTDLTHHQYHGPPLNTL